MKYTYLWLTALYFSICPQNSWAKNNNQLPLNKYKLPINCTPNDYLEKTIVLRVNESYRSLCTNQKINDADLQQKFNKLGVTEIKKLFPFSSVSEKKINAQGQAYTDISLIYQIVYIHDFTVEEAINMLYETKKIHYAEPRFIDKMHFTVNDPQTSQQSFLNKIKAYNAWDVTTGDTNVVIGIVDSGTDIDHPDLVANLKKNYADPINGIDDDGDGYIDNFQGWDVSENDNNPNVDASSHGSHVSGCAAASTNNSIGVASSGFNCKFLPVKCANQSSTTTINNGYEGITYAADHGCHIINCSWGGGFFSQMGQDVITYATINKNALVLASAGNDNIDAPSYPAAFQYVISVAATNASDTKASFSTYNYSVDVSAPGNNIYSTVSDNTYTTMSGTSMSSPIAAGAAGIIKSHFPSFNALQIGEQLRVTCDDIYGIITNNNYKGRLGKGRINMANSLTQTLPSVRMEPINYTDGNDNAFVTGDTISISGDFINYLAPTTNCVVTLSAVTNPTYVNIISPSFTIGALNTLSGTNNNNNPFKIIIDPTALPNATVLFKLTYTDGSTYSDFQNFEMIVNVDYINVTINDVKTTITSKGRSFYNGEGETQGLGFVYRDSSLAYECGLMIGTSTTKTVNTVRGTTSNSDNDFVSQSRVAIDNPSVISDFDLSGVFNDNGATPTAKLNITVKHRAFAWNAPGDMNYVIVRYAIQNNSSNTLNNLYAGIFTDWDIQNYDKNKSDLNAALKLGYSYATTSTQLYGGVKLLSPGLFNFYAADNVTGGGGGINLADGYSTAEKYQTMTTSRPQAGGTGSGNDVINIVSTGPFSVAPNDSVIVAFAFIGGDNLTELETGAVNAQIRYDAAFPLITSFTVNENQLPNFTVFPNPANEVVNFNYTLNPNEIGQIEIYTIEGKLIQSIEAKAALLGNSSVSFKTHNLPSGIYTCKLISKSTTLNAKFCIYRE